VPASSLSRRSFEVEAWGAGGGRAKGRAPRRTRRSADYPPSYSLYSGDHFLFYVFVISYSLYSGDHFLFYVFVISVFSVFTYIHCAHTRSRSALLVYLGERTGSLSGLISLSISDFSIGSVQSHHIYVFCTSSLPRSVFGGPYIYLRTRRSSDPPDTSIPTASKIAQIDL